MMRNARVDQNHKAIVDAFRRMGASVLSLAPLRKTGAPDLVVGIRGLTFLVEVKKPKDDPRPAQREWHAQWRGSKVQVVHSPDEAAALLARYGFTGPVMIVDTKEQAQAMSRWQAEKRDD